MCWYQKFMTSITTAAATANKNCCCYCCYNFYDNYCCCIWLFLWGREGETQRDTPTLVPLIYRGRALQLLPLDLYSAQTMYIESFRWSSHTFKFWLAVQDFNFFFVKFAFGSACVSSFVELTWLRNFLWYLFVILLILPYVFHYFYFFLSIFFLACLFIRYVCNL